MNRRNLTKQEQKWANNLKRIWLDNKRELGLTQESAAAYMGISQSAVGQYINGRIPLNTDATLQFSSLLHVPATEIAPDLDISPIAGYKETDRSHLSNLPLIDWSDLSDWCNTPPTYTPSEHIYSMFPASSDAFIMIVSGESMHPGYREGEYLCVDPAIEAKHGNDILVLTEKNQALFRRYNKTPEGVFLQALNPDWPNKLIEMPDNAKVCGVVIGSWMSRVLDI